MLDITIHDKINQTYKTFKCPSFEVVYEEKDRIGIPVYVLAPFIKKSTYLDYIEIFVKGNKYANGKLFFC